MRGVLDWRKRNRLTQVEAAVALGVSQPYLSLLERGVRPLTASIRTRMGAKRRGDSDSEFRAQLSALGCPGFAHVPKCRARMRPGALLLAVLRRPDADARVVEALPWLVRTYADRMSFPQLVRQAKLHNLQNRLGLVLELAEVRSPEVRSAIRELERARLLTEDTLCWDSMPPAARDWMRSHRTPLAAHWNVLTRMRAEDLVDAA